MKVNLLDLSNGVYYRGEGNANLVVSIPATQAILRFPKSKFSEKCQSEKLDAIVKYINNVFLPELPHYVDPVTTVGLEWHQFHTIRTAVSPYRPASRCMKDIFFPAALVMPDYSLRPPLGCGPSQTPILAVEIKPKLGYIPRNSAHPKICNFCLKQYYKVTTGAVSHRSSYCPLDLFSGDRQRMMTAVTALMTAPQNNMRIFNEGQLMHNENSTSNKKCREFLGSMLGDPDLLPCLLVAALLHEEVKPIPTISKNQFSPPPLDCSKHQCCTKSSLSSSSVLGSVLRLQKSSQLSDEEAEETLESLLQSGWDISILQDLLSDRARSEDSPQIRMLRDYVVAVTAKDISLFLTVSECRDAQSSNMVKVGEKVFCFKWSVVDLDPKNLNRISKYVEQKKTWLTAFQHANK
jgi:inositol-pentakisphosphate 2-kinase